MEPNSSVSPKVANVSGSGLVIVPGASHYFCLTRLLSATCESIGIAMSNLLEQPSSMCLWTLALGTDNSH